MAVEKRYQADVEAILARRYDNGWDFGQRPTLLKGSPFSIIDCALMLLELGIILLRKGQTERTWNQALS